jgi:PAS domain S-box-containing protein
MNLLRRLLNVAPKTQVYLAAALVWLVFLWAGFGFFLVQNINQRLERLAIFSELVLTVAAPVLADAAEGDKTALIQQTLDAASQSPFINRLTVTSPSGLVLWQSVEEKHPLSAPAWLNNGLKNLLPEVQKPLLVGGRLVGWLQLDFETETLANEFWRLLIKSSIFDLLLAFFGIALGLIPLRRALQNLSALGQQADVTLLAIHEGVISCTEQFKLLSINPAAQRLLGFGAAEVPSLLGRDVRALLPGLFFDNEVATNWVGRAYSFSCKDGALLMLETGLSDVAGNDENAVQKVITLRDVSLIHAVILAQEAELAAHKNALAGMKKVANSVSLTTHTSPVSPLPNGSSELNYLTAWVLAMVAERERSRHALEHQKFAMDQHAIVVTCDNNGAISYANERYCALSGFDQAELMGQMFRLFGQIVNAELFYSAMLAVISKGNVWRGSLQAKNKHGGIYWFSATVVPLYNEYLVQESYMLIGTDETEDQQNKVALAVQSNLMSVLLEAIPLAIYFKDKQGRYSLINPAFEKLFGLTRNELIGHTGLNLVALPYYQFSFEKDESLRAQGGVQTFETTYTNPKTGMEMDFSNRRALTSDDQGNTTGIVGVIVDVTERNQFLRQLTDAKRLAEAANQAKSNFLANMSHEIRTPMNGVLGMTELALELAIDPIQREYLNLAKSSGQTLMVVINDILDISKIEANRVDIESIEFSLTDTLQNTLKPVEAMVRKKGLAFELKISPDLPHRVMGDPTRLRQMLLNLCDNAVKFTQEGRVSVHVSGTPVSAGGFDLTVAVTDTGIGIAPNQQNAVFELFSQADAGITRKYGGSGLGLTISLKLAALMGGRITLESVPGQGSTFTLYLRLAVPHGLGQAEALPAPTPAQEPVVMPPVPTSFQVMLVEDNPVNQILCSVILKKLGHTVVVANHGQEALDLFNKQHWDVILMDMQMPVMDGLDATRAIRAQELPGQHTPIVAMTANAMESDRQLCLAAGMDDYLSKPFKFGELQGILEKAVRQNFPLEA